MVYKEYKYKKLGDKEWLEKELATKSMHLVAQEIGCSYSAIVYARNNFNLNVQGKGIKKRHREYDMSLIAKEAYKKTYPNGRFGELASNWRGGRRRGGSGRKYIMIYSPNHPNVTKDGYVMEHRLVMEKKIGRYLKPSEIVHHINGKKDDNRIKNLELVSDRGTHTRNHFKDSFETKRLKKILDQNGIKY